MSLLTHETPSLNEYVDSIINKELNNGDINKLITDISPELNFKYNSFNICIGKQSTGKTTSVLKELIKLGMLNKPEFHLIIYVSNNDSDETFNRLKDYVNIPIVKVNYEKLNETFKKFIEIKDIYNKIVDGKIEVSEEEIEEIKASLFIKNFNNKRLHSIILMDDAAFILKNEKSPWMKWLCQLRHLNCIVFMCIQIWKSVPPVIKSQLSSIQLFPGYSRQQLNYIYQQICVDMKFEEFYNVYTKLGKNNKMVIDNTESEVFIA